LKQVGANEIARHQRCARKGNLGGALSYYAGSTFGTNSSVIGLATNVTLDATSRSYQWIDQGLVVQSKSTDNFNAIDPAVATAGPLRRLPSFRTTGTTTCLFPLTSAAQPTSAGSRRGPSGFNAGRGFVVFENNKPRSGP
jgi:hypothetical protein